MCNVLMCNSCTQPCCSKKYDVVLVSPRNYFLYTPLLPAVATGAVEGRSIVEPVRHLLQGKVGGQASSAGKVQQ